MLFHPTMISLTVFSILFKAKQMITVNKVGEYLIDLITSYILVQTMNLKNLLLKGLPAAVQTELSDERLAKHLYK